MTDTVVGPVINHEGTECSSKGGVGIEDGVVGFQLQLWEPGGLGKWRTPARTSCHIHQTFHQWGGKARASSPTKAVKNLETLNTCALLGWFLNSD